MLNFIRKRLSYSETTLRIGSIELKAIIADSFIKRMIGLMYMEELPQDKCMLFKFSNESALGIWMKNMRFPIDVIWLDSGMKIVTITEALPPCHKILCKTYYPTTDAMYIIELNSGFVKSNGITNLTKVAYPNE